MKFRSTCHRFFDIEEVSDKANISNKVIKSFLQVRNQQSLMNYSNIISCTASLATIISFVFYERFCREFRDEFKGTTRQMQWIDDS